MPAKNRTPRRSASYAKADPPAPPVPTDDHPKKEKQPYRWTVMVYLAGDNNLAEECAYAISEMKAANYCHEDQMQVLVQFDPKASRLPTQRFSIKDEIPDDHCMPKAGARENVFPGPSRYKLGETYTGSPRTLYDFVAWGIQTYPADSYLVVLSGHGGGVEENFLLRDENPSGTLSLREVKDVFRCIKQDFEVVVDIVGLDTCLMSMAEVAYQLKDNASLLVGSEGYSPLGGWPYRSILELLSYQSKNSQIHSVPGTETVSCEVLETERNAAAKGIVCAYANYYFEYIAGGIDVDQSAINISRCDDLTPHVAKLGGRLKYLLELEHPVPFFNEALVLAHWDAQSYDGEIYVDLRDFCACLKERTKKLNCCDQDVDDACDDIINLIGESTAECPCIPDVRMLAQSRGISDSPTEKYVLQSCYTGPSLQYSYGVSVYFPWYEVMPYYDDLDFSQATKWHEFLQVYVQKTRRKRRNDLGDKMRYPDLLGDADSTEPIRQSSGKQSSGKDDKPIIRSMRNPPIALSGLSACFNREQVEWVDELD